MGLKFTGLWRHPYFIKLWGGQTISMFGSEITFLALPLTAVLVLNATPTEMGILGVFEFAPFLLLSLFAGVWVDRWHRRPIMITADLARAVLLFSIPITYALSLLSIGYLYVIALLVGVMTVFFDVAYQSYLPSLVERDQLVEGNGKLEVSRSVAHIAGPGIAGGLIQVVTAPIALVVDAISFLASAFFLILIKKPEKVKATPREGRNIWKEIGEGLGVVFKNPYLRSIAGCTSASNLFSNVSGAVFTLYFIRELKVEPAVLGLIYGVGSVGSLLGAILAGRLAQRFGLGRTIIGSAIMFGVGNIFFPFASDSSFFTLAIVTTGWFIFSLASPIYNINQVSLRQGITPQRLQGRMNASMRFLVWGTMPFGSIIGGFLGDSIGLRPTLVVAAVGLSTCFLWVIFSPVRSLLQQPAIAEEIEQPSPALN